MNRRQRLGRRKREAFIKALAICGEATAAARSVGYTDTRVLRQHYKKDPEFAAEWDAAQEAFGDALEAEAVRRAFQGTYEPVYYQGEVCGYKINKSDTLLVHLLKAYKPDKFGDKSKVEHSHEGMVGVALLPMTAANPEAWENGLLDLRRASEVKDQQMKDVTDKATEATVDG